MALRYEPQKKIAQQVGYRHSWWEELIPQLCTICHIRWQIGDLYLDDVLRHFEQQSQHLEELRQAQASNNQ